MTAPTSPATGGARIKIGFIDIFEWVRSLLTPSELLKCKTPTTVGGVSPTGVAPALPTSPTPDGIPVDGVDTSYVTVMEPNSVGVNVPVYYYWVKDKTTPPPVTTINPTPLTVIEIGTLLEHPTTSGTPWAAIIDSTHLMVYVGDIGIEDNYAIEIEYDQRELDYHTEWLLVAENDKFNSLPLPIGDKILDSITGADLYGSDVPSPLLSDTEKYGTETFPPQTIFVDRTAALQVLVDAINKLSTTRNLNTITDLLTLFPLSDEGTYWVRSAYIESEYVDKPITDTVANISVGDDRLSSKYYVDGDLVKVIQTTNTDLWTGALTGATYVVSNGQFVEIGVDNSTLILTLDIANSASTIRNAIVRAYAVLTKADQNVVAFAALYEMLRQHPGADWFIKTSYMNLQVIDNVVQSPFVRPNETDAIVANALETKPYRTKLRNQIYTHAIDAIEDMGVGITDVVDQKISLWFDRLNCSLEDDLGWNTTPWDAEPSRWDHPFWDWENQGRDDWFKLGTQVGSSSQARYTYVSQFDPTLYDHRLIMKDNGNLINPSDIGLVATFHKLHTSIIVEFNGTLSNNITIELEQSRAFYIGDNPSLGNTLVDTPFTASPSSFKHHVARQMEMGVYAPFESMEECYATPPTNPQERVSNDIIDSVSIRVMTEWTPSYAGWDAVPWDTNGFDSVINNDGPRSFYIMAGNEPVIAAGPAVFMTSEDVAVSDVKFVTRLNNLNISRVDHNGVTLVEGTDYVQSMITPSVVEFINHVDTTYVANGAITTFVLANAPVEEVLLNNVVMTNGVHYTIVGAALNWIQLPPTISPLNIIPLGRHYVGDSVTQSFSNGHPVNSLSENNAFVWKNAVLQIPQTDYTTTSATGKVDFIIPPVLTDNIDMFSLGNVFADSTPRFAAYDLTGDGVVTSYTIGDNANITTVFVFLNGRYQVLGIDYTIPVQGTIDFVVPPINGAMIHMRVLPPSSYTTYDMDHIQFTASGAATDNIVGITDADPDKIMVFVGDTIQNGYSAITTDYTITNGSPDMITWSTPPAPGTPISIRMIRNITIGQTTVIGVTPSNGDVLRVRYGPLLTVGDVVTFYHNNFPIGRLNNVDITSVPTTYDIAGGILTMDNPVLNGFVNITYLADRFGPNMTSLLVCMPRIVNRLLSDHLSHDSPLGYEVNRFIGLRVLNATTATTYEWDGANWIDMNILLVPTDQILILEDAKIVEYDGTVFNTVYSVGDTFTTPPILDYPINGVGIISGGYALGQVSTAASEFPSAYQVWQHNCTP